MSIASVKAEFEALMRELELAYYESYALGRPSRIAECYARHASLTKPETVERLRPFAFDESEEIRDYRLLARAVMTLYVDEKAKDIQDKMADLEAESYVEFDGKRIAYRMLRKYLMEERNRERRKEAMKASLSIVRKLNSLHEEARERKEEAFLSLGFPDVVSGWEKLRFFDRYRVRGMSRKFLRETEGVYRKLWEGYLKERGLDPKDPRLYDVYRVFRAEKYDPIFPAEEMIRRLVLALRRMGFDLLSLPNLKLDVEPREKKAPRAFCCAPDIPGDVRVSVKPMGGVDDYAALFHEIGHALHFAFTRERDPAFKYAGDSSVTECYAFLMEHLLGEREFVAEWAPSRDLLEDYLKFFRFYEKLYFVRRYCGKFLFELEYHGEGADPKEAFSRYSWEASLVRVEDWEAEFYRTFDEEFYTAEYLKAWFGEAVLSSYLKESYGEEWWTKKRAGDFLKELWKTGQKYTLEELFEGLGLKLDPSKLIQEVSELG